MKVLSVACDAGGDAYPLATVMEGLIERGHEVRIHGEHSALKTLRGLSAEMTEAPKELNFAPRLIAATKQLRDTGSGGTEGEVLEAVLESYSHDQARAAGRLLADEFRPDLILTSLVGAAIAYQLANEHGIPYCVVNSDFYIGPDPPRDPRLDFDSRSLPEVEYLLPRVQAADLILVATSREFDWDFTGLPESNHYVGPLLWGDDRGDLPAYFDEPGNPWVLVTLSSQKQRDVPIARLSLDALADQPVRIIETIGRGHRRSEVGAIPPGAHVERFAPHHDVLRHCRLVVSHAGVCSVMNALWFGVPMVLVPWGRDQPGVAARAERLGVARVLPRTELTEERLKDASLSVLHDPSFLERAQRVSARFRDMRPQATACDLIEARYGEPSAAGTA